MIVAHELDSLAVAALAVRRGGRTIGVDRGTDTTTWTYPGATGVWLTGGRNAATNVLCGAADEAQCTVVLDGRTGRKLLTVPGVPKSFVPARSPRQQPGLMTRSDEGRRYAARYGFVTLASTNRGERRAGQRGATSQDDAHLQAP